MKLVLLPGLDGTGRLFKPFISQLNGIGTQIIPIPMEGPQDYETLTHVVASKLPKGPIILLAESFSGPIAANIIALNRFDIQRVVFVATFLTPPRPFLLKLISFLPLKRLMRMPFSDYFINVLLLGRHTDKALLNTFRLILDTVPESIVKERISSIINHTFIHRMTDINALYVLPTHDRLIPEKSVNDFFRTYSRLNVLSIKGPHFILQKNPGECVDKLGAFIPIHKT